MVLSGRGHFSLSPQAALKGEGRGDDPRVRRQLMYLYPLTRIAPVNVSHRQSDPLPSQDVESEPI